VLDPPPPGPLVVVPATAAIAPEKADVTGFPPVPVDVAVAVIRQPAVTPRLLANVTALENVVPLAIVMRPRYTCPWLPVDVAGDA
jgi:hypothetical protein